jgi:uncharacterized membrane protein
MFRNVQKIFQSYDATTRIVIELMRHHRTRLTKTTIRNDLEGHPNYPSLLSIADCLTKWNVENFPGRVDMTVLFDLPMPLITYFRGQFFLVRSAAATTVHCFNGLDEQQIETAEFIRGFSGVILLAQPQQNSGEQDYNSKRRVETLRNLSLPLLFCAGLFVILGWTLHAVGYPGNSAAGLAGISMALDWIGVWTTASLLWYEVDKNNGFIQKICSGGPKVNCTAVLSAKSAKLFERIAWSEIGFFYFAGCMLTLLYSIRLFWMVCILNIAAFPYVFYSVYMQWIKIKRWCLLCLIVQGLLLVGFGVAILSAINGQNGVSLGLLLAALPVLLPIALLPVILWYFMKPFLQANASLREWSKELKRFKFNEDIFKAILFRQKQIEPPSSDLGIVLGDPGAEYTLIKVCNPYCSPCAKAHPDVEELLRTADNLKVQIIFNATNRDGDQLASPVKHFLAIDEAGDKLLTAKALDDWYGADTKDYTNFAAHYPVDECRLSGQSGKLELMSKWCEDIHLEYTPTFFFCGYQLPQPYNVKDLSSFI